MNSQPMPPGELIAVLLQEGRRYVVAMATIFAVLGIGTLVAGEFLLPRNYVASTTILAQDSDIIQPLLEGRAVATGVTDRAGMARQVVYSRKVMDDIVSTGGWLDRNPTAVQRDRLIEQIQDRTRITSPRQDLVQITYRDSDPERTFKVTERLAALLIDESLAAKERESREAYEFIDSQVQDYHAKLTEAEDALQQYRSRNADAQPGSATDVNTRISSLRTQVEQTRMSMLEQQSREQALAAQLSGESAVTAVQTRENLYRSQLIELQNTLDSLLLTYTDQYPDVVRTRHQIEDIQRALQQEEQRRNQPQAGADGAFENSQFNPLYQELRSRLAEVRREVAGTRSRMEIAESLLNGELDRSRRIAASESALAELTRDYEVNRDIYQDLLRRRENARVSMVLDQEKRGLTMRIQDPAIMPLRPTGLRLMHFAAGGLAIAVLVPLGLLFLLARFDPRIRSPQELERRASVPVLAVVPPYRTPRDRRRELGRFALSAVIVLAVFVTYGLTYWIKQSHA
jgi:polysaccharide chain length determinant protein (PEP-CTERM system associated)